MVGKIWSLPVLGPHLLPPSPWSHCPNTLASCCPGNHQACRYLRAFALVPSAQNALLSAASLHHSAHMSPPQGVFLPKAAPSLSFSFCSVWVSSEILLIHLFLYFLSSCPCYNGSSLEAGTLFCVPSCPQHLSLAPSGSLLSGVNGDKPLWSPALEGPVCRRTTRKYPGQSLGEGGGTGTTWGSPGVAKLDLWLCQISHSFDFWPGVDSGEADGSGDPNLNRRGCTGRRGSGVN